MHLVIRFTFLLILFPRVCDKWVDIPVPEISKCEIYQLDKEQDQKLQMDLT